MRRFAAVTLAAGTMAAGIGASAIPAHADPAGYRAEASGVSAAAGGPVTTAARGFNTGAAKNDAFRNVKVWGSAWRTSTGFRYRGTLRDGGRDGWTACARFRATQPGKRTIFHRYVIVGIRNGQRFYADTRVNVNLGTHSIGNKGNLYVQECRRNKATGKFQFGNKKWRKIF